MWELPSSVEKALRCVYFIIRGVARCMVLVSSDMLKPGLPVLGDKYCETESAEQRV
jgi:hypothetical protein